MSTTRRIRSTNVGQLPTGSEKTELVQGMFDAIAPRYDLVNRIMSLGLDQHWRTLTVEALGLAPGALVLDLACGTGDLSRTALRRGYVVVGADLSAGMLAANHGGAPVTQANAAELPFPDACFDGIICGYALRNFTDLAACLREAARVVRPGGRIAVLEVSSPKRAVLRAGFKVWFEHVVPQVGALLSDRDAYRYLPASTAYLPEAHELRALFVMAGFSMVGRTLLQGGLSQMISATRAGMPPQAP
jgi:demethylmenaquinone methyltransferase/2-methoxy-6-polyprenyl-1,4-benzoquinol methylase